MKVELNITKYSPCRIVDFEKFDHLNVSEAITNIIKLNKKLANFWEGGAKGWAPEEVSELLTKSRMDRMVSFSFRLHDAVRDVEQSEEEAHLVSSWVTLGALVESSLTLFFTVWRNDYVENGPRQNIKKGKLIEPPRLSFDQLKSLMLEHDLIDKRAHKWISDIQQYRNVIHFFRDKELGSKDTLLKSIKWYLAFLDFIHDNLPYPDGYSY